jgi:CRISPR-associated protein Cas1
VPTLYLTEDHATVRRDSEDCLLVQIPEHRGENGTVVNPAQKRRIPLIKVDDVVVAGDVTLTAAAIHLLLEKNVEIHFLNSYGTFKGRLSPGLSKNSLLRLAQHSMHHRSVQALEPAYAATTP